eukprot:GHVR01108393.1.p1 GENE.GHVR01108393.1~~GHVR01108393.1.p1  ORF type:complete len:230 (+),score=75.15 GHVR01108393.1:64-753(+)
MHGRRKVEGNSDQSQRDLIAKGFLLIDNVIIKKKDNIKDEETLDILGKLLKANCEFVTGWNYRKDILIFLFKNKSYESILVELDKELSLVMVALEYQPKAYCLWYHRIWTLSFIFIISTNILNFNIFIKKLEEELELCVKFFKKDGRNFHCWNHRQWVTGQLRRFKHKHSIDTNDAKYTEECINNVGDFSNYSLWHLRNISDHFNLSNNNNNTHTHTHTHKHTDTHTHL